MVTRQDTAERVTVVGVKDGGKKFKATRPNGEVQEFTLSVSNPVPCPAMNDDIIVHFDIKTPTDPDKIARFGSEPTFWANKIEPARSDGYSAAPMADVAPAYEETAQRVDALNANAAPDERPREIAEPKKDVYQVEGDAKNRSVEWQVCVKEAAASLRANLEWCVSGDSPRIPITGTQIAFAARQIFYGKEIPTQEEAPAQWQTPQGEPNQEQGEPERQYTG